MERAEELFGYACSGNMEKLKEYYEGGGSIGNSINRFGNEHSLIMGAFRNDQFDTVEYLLGIGEKPTVDEQEEIKKQVRRWELMKRMV